MISSFTDKPIPQLLKKAISFHQQGKTIKAIPIYRTFLKTNPTNPVALDNLATAYFLTGKITQATKTFESAIKTNPKHLSLHYNYAVMLYKLGKITEAIAIFKQVLTLDSTFIRVYEILTNLLISKSEYFEANSYLKQSLSVDPANSNLYHLMGNTLKAEGKISEALSAYRTCLCLNPKDYIALGNLGVVYKHQGNYDQAEKCLTKTIAIDPNQKIFLYSLGIVHEQKWEFGKAYDCFNRAIALDPNFPEPVRNKYLVSRQLCNFKVSQTCEPELDRLLADDPFISIIRHEDLKKNLTVSERWSKDLSANIPKNLFKHKPANKSGKIHLGYLSNDFREHPIGIMTAPMFKHHNRDQFLVSAYSYGADDQSIYRQMIKDTTDRFVDIQNYGIYEAAKKINDDGVDILIDLTGYTENHRLEIMAFRPAPTQITWLGFPGTSGADFIDYLIADRIIIPQEAEKYYSEKIITLPYCYQINNFKPLKVNTHFTRKDLGLPEKGFIFASFNQSYKIDPAIWQSWMNILKRVKDSILVLWQQAPEATDNLLREAKKLGVRKERLIFWNSLPKEQHLARIALFDLGLDTLIYGGHTTTTDCLRMEVPVITKIGNHFASRVCASILHEVGLDNLVVNSLGDYENLAVSLANNPDKLKNLKKKLSREKLANNLFNSQRFVRNLEVAYMSIK